ncbi:MAG: hypothetical protein IK095_06070 [Oscillospiraceae bacterium]|nr:hypothetical protein [Oscillospiraceae bacterium]
MEKTEKSWLPAPNWKGTWREDWRILGQEGYLLNKRLQHRRFSRALCVKDHDQCEFCWRVFDGKAGSPSYAYFDPISKAWICEECYNDFKVHFCWTVEEVRDTGSDQLVKNSLLPPESDA